MRVSLERNRKQLGQSYLQRSEVSSGLPVILTIESTSICNLKCIMCPYPSMGRKNEHMNMTVFEKIVAEGAGSVEFMWLHLFGEPLINPNIYKMIDMAEDAGIRTGISTNATRLDDKASAALLKSKLSMIILSMDGATKQTFEKYRLGAKFDKVYANIARFAEMKRASNSELKATLQMIRMEDTEQEKQQFADTWRDAGFDNILIKDFHYWANQDASLVQINQTPPPLPTGACVEPWIGFVVLADGTVTACCNDYAGKMPLGDLKTQSLREVWNGPEMMKLRRRFQGEVPDVAGTICQDCPFPVAGADEAAQGIGGFAPAEARMAEYMATAQEMPRLFPADSQLSADRHLVNVDVKLCPEQIERGGAFTCEVAITNLSPYTLRTSGSTPVHLSYHWLDANGLPIVFDGPRTRLVPELPSGRQRTYLLDVTAPEVNGSLTLQITLVQEYVAWFEQWDPANGFRQTIRVGQGDDLLAQLATASAGGNGARSGLRAALARIFH